MKKAVFLAFAIAFLPLFVSGQPRPTDKTATATPANLPAAFQARYESGIFGARKKEKGTLRFDDANERVAFHRKDGREMFSMPYESLVMIYPDSKDSTTQTGNVMSRMPLPGAGLFGLMSSSTKYLIINYEEKEVDAHGTASFRFDKKDKLLMFINALGAKAKMVQRGDAYYRPKKRVY